MQFGTYRVAVSTIAIALSAMPLMAQIIPAGEDRWVTPGNGRTKFTFPAGDVESLCGVSVTSSWDHDVGLTGVPAPGWDWDTSVARLADAKLATVGSIATVDIQVTRLELGSLTAQKTPCGWINWRVTTVGNQPRTTMTIKKTSSYGGKFYAPISVSVVFNAKDAQTGAFLGELFYTLNLPDTIGVPWSFVPMREGGYRPGVDTSGNCLIVLRKKLLNATGAHVYYIEKLISQGRKCLEQIDGNAQ